MYHPLVQPQKAAFKFQWVSPVLIGSLQVKPDTVLGGFCMAARFETAPCLHSPVSPGPDDGAMA